MKKLSDRTVQSHSVFISHAAEDRQVAKGIASELKKYGIRPTIDAESIKAGLDWRVHTEQAIKKADAFVVIVSDKANRSHNVSKEWTAIRELTWQKPDLPVISVRLKETDLPAFLKQWQTITIKGKPEAGVASRIYKIISVKSPPQDRHGPSFKNERKKIYARFDKFDQFLKAEHQLKKGPSDEENDEE